MKLVSETECLNCGQKTICVYLISGRHYTAAIADQETGKCLERYRHEENNQKGGFRDVDYKDQMLGMQP